MRESLMHKCRLFIDNRDAFKRTFPMENSYQHSVGALFFNNSDKLADDDILKSVKKILHSRVGAFSSFRSACELPIVAMLAVSDAPERRLDDAVFVYGKLKEHFWSSEYLPLTAMIISDNVPYERYDEISVRTREIYNIMRKKHPMITSSDDCMSSALFALSEMSEEEILRETETCYDALKKKFGSGNFLQSLSQVLALYDDEIRTAADKCRDTAHLYDLLREKKYKYSKNYGLASLGVLAMLPCGMDETVRDLADVAEFLKTQNGYGFWGIGSEYRLVHAAMIVISDRMGYSSVATGTVMNSTISMMAAQQAAFCAAVTASVMVASATRNST